MTFTLVILAYTVSTHTLQLTMTRHKDAQQCEAARVDHVLHPSSDVAPYYSVCIRSDRIVRHKGGA